LVFYGAPKKEWLLREYPKNFTTSMRMSEYQKANSSFKCWKIHLQLYLRHCSVPRETF
jgi:hypothetical protein